MTSSYSEKIAKLKNALENVFIKKTDIQDNLTSTDTNKPLSANQGKILDTNKVDKINGKSLSTNDFTNTYKTKLDNLDTILESKASNTHTHGNLQNDGSIGTSNNVNKNVITDGNGKITTEDKPAIPSASTTVPSADTTNGSYGSGTTYARSNHTHPKSSLYAEATHNHTVSDVTDFIVDDTISNTSTNPVQNKKIYEFEEEILDEIGDKFSATGSVTPISNDWLDSVYPVGSIYMSVNTTNPGTLIGGTWEKIEDKFLLASGNSYTSGSTGGEATHTLTTDEMPSHTHSTEWNIWNQGSDVTTSANAVNWSSHSTIKINGISNTGGGQAHNNMPPYLVVNVWYRIG